MSRKMRRFIAHKRHRRKSLALIKVPNDNITPKLRRSENRNVPPAVPSGATDIG